MKINFEKPAAKWGEALPIGNGHIGGMVYSGIETDTIDLSENTFFSGEKSTENNRKGACEAFHTMREQSQKGDFESVQHTSDAFIGYRKNYGTNLPVGSLFIDYGHDPARVSDYKRSLSILDGVVETTYQYEGISMRRTVFVSHPHGVLVYRVCAGDDILPDVRAGFKGTGAPFWVEGNDGGLDFLVDAHENMHSDGKTGVNLCGTIVVMTDGQIIITDTIHVCGAKEIIFYTGMATNFNETMSMGTIRKNLREHTAACVRAGWGTVKDLHIRDINRLMNRVDLAVSGEDIASKAVSLAPLMFQYGRYLLLSSSREDSRLPAHLQGIWNDNVACRIGWTCDMHLDINTQMNYWPSEVTDLPETAMSLFRWIEEDLVPSGRRSACESYGLKGWTAELVSNAWGFSAPYWAASISPCPTGGVWILTHMWEHYLSTQDEDFLERHAYGVIEEAAAFFADYLFEDPATGFLTCGPSISPENGFCVDGKTCYISNGSTYELIMIRELFSIYREASSVLGIDNALVKKACGALDRLPPYRILSDGKIAEWSHDYPSHDLQHRHTSHLLGVFPFAQITPERTPALSDAVKVSLHEKLTPLDSWEDTGWARSLMTLYAARLADGESAYRHIESMLNTLLAENYMIIHPPTRGAGSFDNVYELDGNTGLTASIAEMLMQSHNGVIRLLPALPYAWKSGHVTGLIARGGIRTDIYWDKGGLVRAVFESPRDTTCRVQYKDKMKILILKGMEKQLFLEKSD